jgi:hypothetical protein
MNKEKRKQVIIVVVLLLVLLGVVYWQFLRPDPLRQQQRANYEQNPGIDQLVNQPRPATTRSGAPPAPAAAPAAATGAIGTPGIDLEELVSRVQSVDFNYELAMREKPRNPMTPLVGLRAPGAESGEPGAEDEESRTGVADYQALRIASNMVVTGIMYDASRPMAVVDNEVVHPGYTFPSGVVVDTIEPERVLLRINESVVPVELEER